MNDRRATRLETFDGYALLTLDTPQNRNALTDSDMLTELVATFEHPPAGVRVLVVTGAGTAFSAGGNVKAMAEGSGIFAGEPDEVAEGYRHSIQRLSRAIAGTDLVTIAAVNGPAVGAGFDLVLSCDLRIASADAWFSHPFAELGIIPGDGGLWWLARTVGHQRAAELSFTGRRLPAAEALDWGVLLRTVPGSDLITNATELADTIAHKPAHSIRLTKRLLRHAATMDFDGFLELTAALQALSHANPEHAKALTSYLDRLDRPT